MATVSVAATNPTLADWKAALGPDNMIGDLINVLQQTNEVVGDVTMMEGNEPTGHLMNIASGLPSATMRRLYEGIKPTKGQRVQVREHVGWLEAFHELDKKLYDLAGNGDAFRLQEAMLEVESMGRGFTKQVFYGDHANNAEEIFGLAPRYNSTSAGESRRNVIDGGGTSSDNASVWLVNWGPKAIFTFAAKGMPAGLQMEDLGDDVADNYGGVTGALLRVKRMHFSWDFGLGVADWRYGARLCNIDRSNLTFDASSGANLPQLMSQMIRKTPRRSMNNARFYMDSSVMGFFEAQISAAVKESTLRREDVGGVMTDTWKGIPIRQVDQLEVNEAQVT